MTPSQRTGPGPFDEWDLRHYGFRPESERAAFWERASAAAKAAMESAIQSLPAGHRIRVQADRLGWVPDVI